MQNVIEQTQEELKADLGEAWFTAIAEEFTKDYMLKLQSFLREERKTQTIYPAREDTFNAFKYCPLDKVKVVILGQDPYHGQGQAHGLCFSVKRGIKPPPSLVNIFKELEASVARFTRPKHGELSAWAHQGVFLLNTCLSVRAGEPSSHFNKGWEIFTNKVIQTINEECEGVVFMLWGAPARKKAAMIDKNKHLVLEAPHPSPLSAHRGFLGCGHFSQANDYLQEQEKTVIDWRL